MSFFLIAFLSVYAGIHAYAFFRAKAAFQFGTAAAVVVVAIMALMIFAPLLVRITERAGFDPAARTIAFAAYTWLGLLFLFFSYSLAFDVLRIFAYVGSLLRVVPEWFASPTTVFVLPLILAVLTSVYGYFDAQRVRTEHLRIVTEKIAPRERLRIVQISDVHLGLIVRESRLRNILGKVHEAKPDILVSTGDLVDGEVCDLKQLSQLFSTIPAQYGKFAVTGNHEFYAGLKNAACFTEEAGFSLLRGEAVRTGGIIIAGVDDPAGRATGAGTKRGEAEVLSSLPKQSFRVLLKHRPFVDRESAGLFDLQLSGHVHRGQIFPFTLITWMYYPVQSGLARLGADAVLYVSRGAGTWGPPIRFLSPPEIAVIDIVRQ